MRLLIISIVLMLCSFITMAQPSGYIGNKTLFFVETGLGPSFSKIAVLDEKAPLFNQNFSFGVQRTVTNHLTLGFTYSTQSYIRDSYIDFEEAIYDLDYGYLINNDEYDYVISFYDPQFYSKAINHHFKFVVSKSRKYIAPVGKFQSFEFGISYAKIEMMHENSTEPIQLDSVRSVTSPTIGYSYYIQKPLIGNLFIRYGYSINVSLNGILGYLSEKNNVGYYVASDYENYKDWKILKIGMRENIILDGLFKVNLGIGFLAF